MTYELKDPFWILVDHWQTLIAGIMALIAGAGTIWATIRAADREIAAAQEQIRVAQQQIETSLDMEKKRMLREAHGFLSMFIAVMNAVLDDAKAAREIFGGVAGDGTSAPAFEARQQFE